MKPHFDHALVALDQSASSDIIADCLPSFRKFGTRKITLFTSLSVSYPGGASGRGEEEYRQTMESYIPKIERQGYTVDADVRFTINAYHPAEIVSAAAEHGADYLIIGNRGHSKLHDIFLGSTASETMQRAHLPVYVINIGVSAERDPEERRLYCVRACSESLYHIFHATDFSDTAERAFEALKKISPDNSRKITLFHVQDLNKTGRGDPQKIEEYNAIDRERLEQRKADLAQHTDAEIDIRIAAGPPAEEILAAAAGSDATLILMGSQGRGYVRELFLGGVSYNVLRASSTPVFIIAAKRE
jgi:nucleotide-binding universal stress UspA family protein